jgi:hypothetical protein
LDINGSDFTPWAKKYGPHEYNGDLFTFIIRWNLPGPGNIYTSGIIVDGYQNRTNTPPSRPFALEDIVIVYDGCCTSTCTIFSEFMTHRLASKPLLSEDARNTASCKPSVAPKVGLT